MGRFDEIYGRSLEDPEGFWGEVAELVHWEKKWDKVLDATGAPFYRWFTGGMLNTCYNALDRHVEAGRGDQAALIYDSPVTDTVKTYSYSELTDAVAAFAGALAAQGVAKGDRVIVYMPMIPEARRLGPYDRGHSGAGSRGSSTRRRTNRRAPRPSALRSTCWRRRPSSTGSSVRFTFGSPGTTGGWRSISRTAAGALSLFGPAAGRWESHR